jgi:hypothetical protein
MKPIEPAYTVVVNRTRLVNQEDPFGRFPCRDSAWAAVQHRVQLIYNGDPRLPEVLTAVEQCKNTGVTDLELFGRFVPGTKVLIGVHAV